MTLYVTSNVLHYLVFKSTCWEAMLHRSPKPGQGSPRDTTPQTALLVIITKIWGQTRQEGVGEITCQVSATREGGNHNEYQAKSAEVHRPEESIECQAYPHNERILSVTTQSSSSTLLVTKLTYLTFTSNRKFSPKTHHASSSLLPGQTCKRRDCRTLPSFYHITFRAQICPGCLCDLPRERNQDTRILKEKI